MKKIAYVAFASAAALTLAACGSSESADGEATAENVEMPAEEAMGEADATAEPAADAMAAEGEATAEEGAAEETAEAEAPAEGEEAAE